MTTVATTAAMIAVTVTASRATAAAAATGTAATAAGAVGITVAATAAAAAVSVSVTGQPGEAWTLPISAAVWRFIARRKTARVTTIEAISCIQQQSRDSIYFKQYLYSIHSHVPPLTLPRSQRVKLAAPKAMWIIMWILLHNFVNPLFKFLSISFAGELSLEQPCHVFRLCREAHGEIEW